jgi:hypothetical protein
MSLLSELLDDAKALVAKVEAAVEAEAKAVEGEVEKAVDQPAPATEGVQTSSDLK